MFRLFRGIEIYRVIADSKTKVLKVKGFENTVIEVKLSFGVLFPETIKDVKLYKLVPIISKLQEHNVWKEGRSHPHYLMTRAPRVTIASPVIRYVISAL